VPRPPAYFRAGVGAVIVDSRGRLLLFERNDISGSWQFPQGGLDRGERPLDGVYREIEEETAIKRRALTLLHRYPGLLAYEVPRRSRSKKTGLGQVQYWFLFLHKGGAISIPRDTEFRSVTTVSFRTAVARVVGFKRPLYRQLADEFGPIVARLRLGRIPRTHG
jgi:putative (di)nucleoside polyphosphate hydrolase